MLLEIHPVFTRKLIPRINGRIPCMVIQILGRCRQFSWVLKIFTSVAICTEVWFDELRLDEH